MKRLIYIFFIVFLLSSCMVTRTPSKMAGTYAGKFRGREMKLNLHKDKSFCVNWYQIDYTGQWEYLKNDIILFKFDEAPIKPIKGYFLELSNVSVNREKIIDIKNPNELSYDKNTVLIRQNN